MSAEPKVDDAKKRWANRIVGEAMVNPAELTANPLNFRTHGADQQKALTGAIDRLGWIQRVVVNKRTGRIVDGHLRADLAKRHGELVPVVYVDLDDEEERIALATLDPIAAMAGQDNEVLDALVASIQTAGKDLGSFLSSIRTPPSSEKKEAVMTLAELFLVPPFSILDGRSGPWIERKRAWKKLGIRSEVGRDDNLTYAKSCQTPETYQRKAAIEARDGRSYSWEEFSEISPGGMLAGTSIFDPVLCEVAYRWFAPPNARILDPFAGGSVRGVVASVLGHNYTGVDIRVEQVEANRQNWAEIRGALPSNIGTEAPPLRVTTEEGIRVVRDDDVPGGTKRRVLDKLLPELPEREFVYASPAFGFAQYALAIAAAGCGKQATIFVAARKKLHPRTRAAAYAGANIVEVPNGYLSNVQAKAKDYAESRGARYFEFGADDPRFIEIYADLARSTGESPSEVWCVAGSGVTARALKQAWPDAIIHAVKIGAEPDAGQAVIYEAPEDFEQPAKDPPPWPSCPEYDAKAWQFIKRHASPGALFWNVANEVPARLGDGRFPDPEWVAGDSTQLDQILDSNDLYDLVFTCPPYGDLEVYSDDPADISGLGYAEFLKAYRAIIAKAAARLRDNRFMVVVVGEFRDKKGTCRGFVPDTIAAATDAGLRFYNEAIYLQPLGAVIIRAANSMRATRKLGKVHQQALVFAKGDPEPADIPGITRAISEELSDAFKRDRHLIERVQKVLVFAKGDPAEAAKDMGDPPLADDTTELLEDAIEHIQDESK